MRTVSHEAGDPGRAKGRDTETYWSGQRARDPGEVPIRDYIEMAHPECRLLGKASLRWMLFTFFVAGLCCGLLLGRVLA